MNPIEKIIVGSVKHRIIVIALTAAIVLWASYSLFTLPVDAIPDLSDVQVIVLADYPGQTPQVVEDQVVYPLTTTLMSVPGVKSVRGYSNFNFGMVYMLFEDGVDLYWARSRVLEYLSQAAGKMPEGVTPRLGPDATGLGWVYQYTLQSDKHSLAELRSMQDWYLRYELQSVPGVAEVAPVGGFVKQYLVEVRPERLAALGMSADHVMMALKEANADIGGGMIEMSETEYYVRGLGYYRGKTDNEIIKQIENTTVEAMDGKPMKIKQVADVRLGPEMRRGSAEWNGEGEVVGGIIVMRYGENALAVIDRVKARLEQLKAGLPEGVKIVTAYDRSDLIRRAIDTLKGTLTEEMIVVALVTIIFLLHLPSALVALFVLPAGVLISLLAMKLLGINANIMSLGGIAIAIGVMVDASIVMVENAHKHLERGLGTRTRAQLIADAAAEVGPALFFSLLIVTVSFMPVFSLQAQEGKLFRPLAYTKTFSMAASSILAITIIPALMVFFIRGKIIREDKHPVSRFLIKLYKPLMKPVLKIPGVIVLICLVLMAASIFPWTKLGHEFMPALNEGDLLYMPTTPPGISPAKALEVLQQTDRIIKSFPEVHHVFGKVGRAESATDPAPMSMVETVVMLQRDPKKWRKGVSMDSLIQELDASIRFPGVTNSWTMPIRTRIDMLTTGIKTPIGIKIMGDNLDTLNNIGENIEAIAQAYPGVTSAYSERAVGGKFIDVKIDREAAGRYGLTVKKIEDNLMAALEGMPSTYTVEGLARYGIKVRYPWERRDDLPDIKRILIPLPRGGNVPLAQVAEIKIADGPPMIKSENARKTVWVYIDTWQSDIGGLVEGLQNAVAQEMKLPEGYSLQWSGQFEFMQRASQRLKIIVPLTLVLIFFLLYLHFGNLTETFIVIFSLPFALVGGVWLMYILNYNLSVASAVGYIALLGLAAETGVVMLVYLDISYRNFKKEGRLNSLQDLKAAVIEGAVERVRPKMMTVSTTIVGLLPVMFGTGTGAEVMKRIAAPMVGGLISSTILTLIILPAAYYLVKRKGLKS